MKSFWNLKHCSKLDILTERHHLPIIVSALEDQLTQVDRIDKNTFSLNGPEEALLVQPTDPLLYLTLQLAMSIDYTTAKS